MTGFGKATTELPNKKITVEIKSLNSKQLDLSARISSQFREKEIELRNIVAQHVERGKVDLAIYIESLHIENAPRINQSVIEGYFNQIKEIAANLEMDLPSDWFQTLLRMPDAMKAEAKETNPEELNIITETLLEAIAQLCEFRRQEGEMLYNLFVQKIQNIADLLKEVPKYEQERIDKVKSRITDALSKIEGYDYDKNRFEQEMIFYIEKLDLNEEKHRLDNHLKYFIETLDTGSGQGKKLGFICQEIGREINTLGSKSNHVELQKIVVRMKDELEQIKEQVLNVL